MRSSFLVSLVLFFFFNDTATTEIYTLSLHDALPILAPHGVGDVHGDAAVAAGRQARVRRGDHEARAALGARHRGGRDRKSTRLNSSHANLVCRLLLEKKKQKTILQSKYTICTTPLSL